jgi:hypothetical protein
VQLLAASQATRADIFLKMTVFWDVAPCSLAEVYRRFRGAYCLHYQSLMMETGSASNTEKSEIFACVFEPPLSTLSFI